MNKEKEFEINFACELNTLSLEEMSKQYFRKLKNKDKKIKKQEKKYRKLERYYSQQIIWLKENKIEIDKIKQKLQAKEQECEQLRGGQHHQGKIIKELTAECEELKQNYRKQLHKNLEKQCRINELQNSVATKEFILKVNGKKYANLSGIDKARLFINNEIDTRNKKIIELENEISSLQWKFYDNCKKTVEAQKQLDQLKAYIKEDLVPHAKLYKKALKEVKEIAQYDVYTSRTDLCIKLNWVKKKISEVIKDEE